MQKKKKVSTAKAKWNQSVTGSEKEKVCVSASQLNSNKE